MAYPRGRPIRRRNIRNSAIAGAATATHPSSLGSELQRIFLQFVSIAGGGLGGLTALAVGVGFLVHNSQLRMLGFPPFSLSPIGYSSLAFGFLTETTVYVLESLLPAVVIFVPCTLLLVWLSRVVLPRMVGRRCLLDPDQRYVAATILFVALALALVFRMAYPIWNTKDLLANGAVHQQAYSVLDDGTAHGLPARTVPSIAMLMMRGLRGDAVEEGLRRRDLAVFRGHGRATQICLSAIGLDAHDDDKLFPIDPPGVSVKLEVLVARCWGDYLDYEYKIAAASAVMLAISYLVLRRRRCDLGKDSSLAFAAFLVDLPAPLLVGFIFLLLPQYYGLLVLPPRFPIVEVQSTSRGNLWKDDVCPERLLVSFSPRDAKTLVLLTVPALTEESGGYLIETLDADKVAAVRYVGGMDPLQDGFSGDEALTYREAARLLVTVLREKGERPEQESTNQNEFLKAHCVWNARECMGVTTEYQSPIERRQFSFWALICQMPRQERAQLIANLPPNRKARQELMRECENLLARGFPDETGPDITVRQAYMWARVANSLDPRIIRAVLAGKPAFSL